MDKKTERTPSIIGGIISIILVISFMKGCIFGNKETTTEVTNNKQETVTKESKQEEQKELTLEEHLKKVDSSIKVTGSKDNGGYYLVTVKYTDDSLKHIANKCYHILKSFKEHKEYNNVNKIGIMIMADFNDKYGNTTEEKSFSVDFPKAELDKVNWDNFLWEKTLELGQEVWMHKTIKQDI
ncbi:hypothetical protein [Clostridium brassicae]|uniref:Lipoprotein n=1 Tax=Clostridium brassicae TaxID=2999072 RepID=A0ABT4D6G8_9CLOT|nr:hypothetical protein [Clostridium brassicae]MCY6957890.1 hypothetical protein [Clostridium brassicae]